MFAFLKKRKASPDPKSTQQHGDDIFAAIKPILDNSTNFGTITPLIQVNEAGGAFIALEIDPKYGAMMESLRQRVQRAAEGVDGTKSAQVVLTAQHKASENVDMPSKNKPSHTSHADLPKGKAASPFNPVPLAHVKKVILVASGKGGVGKSTVAANLAVSMGALGYNVGLMDADIYGPSQPTMMGVEGKKPAGKQGDITPLTANGIKVLSIGLMVDKDAALIWRGPIVQKALMQLSFDANWGTEEKPLDYLFIDLPPGTGDVQLTLAQKIKIDGAVIVSTPQDIALIDARRGIAMFEKTNTPILGLIENMSTHICSACGHEEEIFGHGGAEKEAKAMNIPFLGAIPLSLDIRKDADNGKVKPSETFKDIANSIHEAFDQKS